MSNQEIEVSSDETQLTVELSGVEIENKVKYYFELKNQLFCHLDSYIRQSATSEFIITNKDPVLIGVAYQSLADSYMIALQKYSKWNEFFTFFAITTSVSVLGKDTTLLDAIETQKGFDKLSHSWDCSIRTFVDASFERRITEPSLQSMLKQKESVAAIEAAYDAVIKEGKTRKIKIMVTKKFFEL